MKLEQPVRTYNSLGSLQPRALNSTNHYRQVKQAWDEGATCVCVCVCLHWGRKLPKHMDQHTCLWTSEYDFHNHIHLQVCKRQTGLHFHPNYSTGIASRLQHTIKWSNGSYTSTCKKRQNNCYNISPKLERRNAAEVNISIRTFR